MPLRLNRTLLFVTDVGPPIPFSTRTSCVHLTRRTFSPFQARYGTLDSWGLNASIPALSPLASAGGCSAAAPAVPTAIAAAATSTRQATRLNRSLVETLVAFNSLPPLSYYVDEHSLRGLLETCASAARTCYLGSVAPDVPPSFPRAGLGRHGRSFRPVSTRFGALLQG